MKMRYCKRCLQPDTRPGIIFDDEQICFACRYEESKATIDWAAREAELKGFAEEAKAEGAAPAEAPAEEAAPAEAEAPAAEEAKAEE